jgi:hypothetical protein
MKEIFRDIERYEGLYQISNFGQVKSLKRIDLNNHLLEEKILKNSLTLKGYFQTALYKDSKVARFATHRLVAQAFIPNLENKPQINHKNGVKICNEVWNLEWVTAKENTCHAEKMNLRNSKGENNFTSKLKNEEIIKIRNECKKYTVPILSKKYNIDEITIWRIIKGEAWNHIPYFEKEENIKFFNSEEYKLLKSRQRKNVKLSEREVKEILRLKGKRPQKIIAKFYNISKDHVKGIHRRKVWSWVEV